MQTIPLFLIPIIQWKTPKPRVKWWFIEVLAAHTSLQLVLPHTKYIQCVIIALLWCEWVCAKIHVYACNSIIYICGLQWLFKHKHIDHKCVFYNFLPTLYIAKIHVMGEHGWNYMRACFAAPWLTGPLSQLQQLAVEENRQQLPLLGEGRCP